MFKHNFTNQLLFDSDPEYNRDLSFHQSREAGYIKIILFTRWQHWSSWMFVLFKPF